MKTALQAYNSWATKLGASNMSYLQTNRKKIKKNLEIAYLLSASMRLPKTIFTNAEVIDSVNKCSNGSCQYPSENPTIWDVDRIAPPEYVKIMEAVKKVLKGVAVAWWWARLFTSVEVGMVVG